MIIIDDRAVEKVTVFCGSNRGTDENLVAQAQQLGKLLAQNQVELIYGGTDVGLMCVIADSVMENGGRVTGVIPTEIEELKLAHPSLNRLIHVDSIQQRKEQLYALGDALIAFPGSYGTMDELFNALVLRQLGKLEKPIVLLNINGFYDGLLLQLQRMEQDGFLKHANRLKLTVYDRVAYLAP